jgi:hypothetical protein
MAITRKKPSVGDVIAITLADSQDAYARVLFLSQVYKDVMLLGLYGPDLKVLQGADLDSLRFVSMVYTTAATVRTGRWKILLSQPLQDELQFSLRIIGTALWSGDEPIREADQRDKQMFPIMRVSGYSAVEQYVGCVHGQGGASKFSQITTRDMGKLLTFLYEGSSV